MDSQDLEFDGVESDLESNDSEDITLTAAQVIAIMETSWLNEKFAPEILPHKSEIVDCLLGQITYMEGNLQNLGNNDFQKSLHQMEIDRLRFMITSYLRTRLEKIETYVLSILKGEEQRSERNEPLYLTSNELEFAKTYKESLDHHFESTMHVWPGLDPDDWKKNLIWPNMYSFVFAKSKTEIEGVMIEDGNDEEEALVDLGSESQMIISYNSIAPLIKNDQVILNIQLCIDKGGLSLGKILQYFKNLQFGHEMVTWPSMPDLMAMNFACRNL